MSLKQADTLSLKALQSAFVGSPRDPSARELFEAQLCSDDILSAQQRLDIYIGSMTHALVNTLCETYPVCSQLLGQARFAVIAEEFIASTPSRSPNLNDYGNNFSVFLAQHSFLRDQAYLPDVARLEWLWQQAYNGSDNTMLDFEALRAASERSTDSVVLHPVSNSYLLATAYPALGIWTCLCDDGDSDALADIHLDSGPEYLFIWRQGVDTRVDKLSAAEYLLLEKMMQGATLSELMAFCEQEKIDIAELLPVFTTRGYLGAFSERK